MSRLSWDAYFLEIAKVTASRSVCYRSKCGAVIVKDNAIVSTGYNGAPRHQPNCEEIGFCYREKHHIASGTELERCRACGCHSETNAIALAARHGHSTDGATIYVYGNTQICTQCRGMISNAGIIRVVHLTHTGNQVEYIPARDWTIHPIDHENNVCDTLKIGSTNINPYGNPVKKLYFGQDSQKKD